jgi:hypothetical protein
VTGEDAFEVAAAVASISGFGALILLALVAVVGAWLLLRRAADAASASSRAVMAVEELAHATRDRLGEGAGSAALEELGRRAEALLEQQTRLQEATQQLLDAAGRGAGSEPALVDDLAAAVSRLDTTVGQMATSLANLIQMLERQQ